MKLIYITSQKYPSGKVEPFFIKSMAEAFHTILAQNFLFIIRGRIPSDLKFLNVLSVSLPWRFRRVTYFLVTPVLVIVHRWNKVDNIFFSSDPYLLSALIFWRKIFPFQYRVCSDWHQLFGDWRDKYVAQQSDFLVTTSKKLSGLLTSVCAVNQSNIVVAYGGVNLEVYRERAKISKTEYRDRLELPVGKFIVGYVGGFKSLGLEKGLDTMIRALKYLDSSVSMAFVGGSRETAEEYVALAKSEGVENRCLFVGKQVFNKVIEYQLAMDVLVIPYPDRPHFRDYGFPMKVWEYMASGRPIIYSNLEIIDEALSERGVPFIPDDERSLADAIRSICDNLKMHEEMAKKNVISVRNFTWRARAQNIIDFIKR